MIYSKVLDKLLKNSGSNGPTFMKCILSGESLVETHWKKYHYLNNNLENQRDSKTKQLNNQGIEPNHHE